LQKTLSYIVRTIILGIFIGVVISSIIMIFQAILGRTFHWDQNMIREFFYNVLMGLALTLVNGVYFDYLNNRVSWSKGKEYYRIIVGIIGSIPLTLFGVWIVRFIIQVGFENQSFESFSKSQYFNDYLGSLIITFFVSLIFHVVFLYRKLQDNKVKEQKIIAGNASAQFESLKNQIDPHFLFNSLNVLSSLIEENPDNAQRFTTSLSKIYRYVLEQRDKELVPLQEELNFAKTYMKLLIMRFENSLTYSLPDSIIDDEAKVVPLSLQLLLENTIKHNIVSDIQPLHIVIKVEGEYLTVSNNLQKKEVLQNGEGVGLKNIINRYAILTDKKVKIESDVAYFKVKIPILTKEITLIKNKKYNEMDAYVKAKKQVKEMKEFYGNLIAYCFVIPVLALVNYMTFWQFKWFLFPMIGWGLAVAFQAFSVFGFMRTWEEKKIYELLEKEQQYKNNKWL
jgi:two-component system LytT family sensor kinase